MFRITADTCRAFTLAEILILAAINVESARLDRRAAVKFTSQVNGVPHPSECSS
jgi:hypothetical protein